MAQTVPIKLINTSDKKDQNNWYENNVWKLDQLGVKGSVTERQLSINFDNFHQNWLKELVKKYLKICAISGSAAKIVQSISALKLFSTFLMDVYPNINAEGINRSIIEDYLFFLNKKSIKPTTKNNRIINLSGFLKMCHTRKWIANIDPFLMQLV